MEQALPFAGGTFAQILRSLVGPCTPADKPIVRLRSEYARHAADEVLAATDLENLSDRLDALSVDSEFWQHETIPGAKANWEAFRAAVQVPLDMPSLTRTLGITAAQRCERGWNAFGSALPRIDRLKQKFDEEFPSLSGTGPEAAIRRSEIVDYVYDLSVPPALRRTIASFLRNVAATCAIARAEERGQRLDPWLALGLANFWAEGPERLASALAETETFAAWLLSIISHFDRAQRLREMVEQSKQAAAASGEGVHYPFGHVDQGL